MQIYKLLYINNEGLYNTRYSDSYMNLESYVVRNKFLVWKIYALYYDKKEEVFSCIGKTVKKSACFNNHYIPDVGRNDGRHLFEEIQPENCREIDEDLPF